MDGADWPEVATAVYKQLFSTNAPELDTSVLPYALDDALRALRNQGAELTRWATYTHTAL